MDTLKVGSIVKLRKMRNLDRTYLVKDISKSTAGRVLLEVTSGPGDRAPFWTFARWYEVSQ